MTIDQLIKQTRELKMNVLTVGERFEQEDVEANKEILDELEAAYTALNAVRRSLSKASQATVNR